MSWERDVLDVLDDVYEAGGREGAVRGRVEGDLKKENCLTRDDE